MKLQWKVIPERHKGSSRQLPIFIFCSTWDAEVGGVCYKKFRSDWYAHSHTYINIISIATRVWQVKAFHILFLSIVKKAANSINSSWLSFLSYPFPIPFKNILTDGQENSELLAKINNSDLQMFIEKLSCGTYIFFSLCWIFGILRGWGQTKIETDCNNCRKRKLRDPNVVSPLFFPLPPYMEKHLKFHCLISIPNEIQISPIWEFRQI